MLTLHVCVSVSKCGTNVSSSMSCWSYDILLGLSRHYSFLLIIILSSEESKVDEKNTIRSNANNFTSREYHIQQMSRVTLLYWHKLLDARSERFSLCCPIIKQLRVLLVLNTRLSISHFNFNLWNQQFMESIQIIHLHKGKLRK